MDNSLAKGILAGSVATLCMSAVMLVSKRIGAQGEHAPKKITAAVLQATTGQRPRGRALNAATVAAHLGYGAAAGGLYGVTHRRLLPKALPLLQGIAYGLIIWALSYKGWAPNFGILPPPERDRPGRVKTLILAHLVYGAVLGMTSDGRHLKTA